MPRKPRRIDQSEVPGERNVRRQAESREGTEIEPVAHAVLRLQRSAGNHAVSALLAREPDRAAAGKKEGDAGSGDDGPVNTTLTMPDPIGVLPLESFSVDGHAGQIEVTVASTAADAALFQHASSGQMVASATISARGFTLTLTEVLISMIQVSGGQIRFSLNGKTVATGHPDTGEPPKAG
jgi:hypothetical protein